MSSWHLFFLLIPVRNHLGDVLSFRMQKEISLRKWKKGRREERREEERRQEEEERKEGAIAQR